MSRFVVERANGALEPVHADSIGMDEQSLFFYNGAKTAENVVKTFNHRGGWLSVVRTDKGE